MATTLDSLSKNLTDTADTFGGDLAGLIKGIVSQIAKLFDQLMKAIADGLDSIKPQLGDALTYVADKIGDIWQAVVDFIQRGMKAIFPSPLESGPGEAINAAVELSGFINTSFPAFGLADRVDIVADSFAEMINRAGDAGDLTIISEASNLIKQFLSGLTTSGSPVDKIRQLLISLLVPSKTQVVSLLKSVANGRWWGWAELPTGFTPGKLHEWINDPASYTKIDGGNSSPMNAALIPIARRFRCQVVMAIDAFLRSKVNQSLQATSLTESDRRMSYQSLTDLICTLLDTTINFLFEPVDVPITDADLDGFEDVGIGFASSLSRQVRVMIRGTIGTLFRGVWEYSLHSDALIELFSSVVGTALSAIFESVARNLTWSIRVVSRYNGDPFGGAPGVVIPSIDQSAPITGSGVAVQKVEYVAFRRDQGLTAAPVAVGDTLLKMLSDLAAYSDACYQQFRADRRFPAVATDNVSGIVGKVKGTKFTLQAISLPIDGDDPSLPRAVLRAYFGPNMVVMAPGTSPNDNYQMEFQFAAAPRKGFEVTVLSSRGGVASAVIGLS